MSDLAAGRLLYAGIAPRHMANRTNRQGNAESSLRRTEAGSVRCRAPWAPALLRPGRAQRPGRSTGRPPPVGRGGEGAAQPRGIIAVDFVHVDTVLLRRVYALIVIEHGTRRAHLAGITTTRTAHGRRKRPATW